MRIGGDSTAVLEANRWRNLYSSKETELIAANQRIKELETIASRVVPTAAMTERITYSPTETPYIPRGEGSGMDELLRGATTLSSPLPTYRQPTVPTTTSQKLGAIISMTPRGSRSNQPPSDHNTIAVTAIAQNMITGKPVALEGTHLTPAQVKKFVDNVRAQLRTIIDEKAWGII